MIKILQGTPFRRKSLVSRYGIPNEFSCEIAVMFGNPDTGNPIAAEHTNAVPFLKKNIVYSAYVLRKKKGVTYHH